jgi:hypothetical protein
MICVSYKLKQFQVDDRFSHPILRLCSFKLCNFKTTQLRYTHESSNNTNYPHAPFDRRVDSAGYQQLHCYRYSPVSFNVPYAANTNADKIKHNTK